MHGVVSVVCRWAGLGFLSRGGLCSVSRGREAEAGVAVRGMWYCTLSKLETALYLLGLGLNATTFLNFAYEVLPGTTITRFCPHDADHSIQTSRGVAGVLQQPRRSWGD